MEATPIQWWPAYLALALGVVAGMLLVTGLPPRAGQSTPSARQRRQDDELDLSSTLSSLADLEDRRPALEPAFYDEEKRRLEARAVELLKRTRAQAAEPQAKTSRAAATPPAGRLLAALHGRPRLRQGMWLVLIASVGGFLFWDLGSASVRQRSSEGGAMGAAPQGGAEAVDEQELQELRGRLTANPEDVGALLRVAHLALRAQQFEEAELFNSRALSLAPRSLEGRVHQAMLRAKDGDAAAAMVQLTEINKEDPGLAEAWFFRGMLGMQSGDMTVMREAFEQFVAVAPDGAQKDRVRAMLQRSKT